MPINQQYNPNHKAVIGVWMKENGTRLEDIMDNDQVRANGGWKRYKSKSKPHRKGRELPLHWHVTDTILGCPAGRGAMVSEYGNKTTDPKKVTCGICRSIMIAAIKRIK
tara:strand:+ start:635 stop:961 length:327 start_codon:yes stop_codon:yes gene_type:complete